LSSAASIEARRFAFASAAIGIVATAARSVWKRSFSAVLRGNESRSHSAIVHARITVPAPSRKLRVRSHIIRSTDGQCGIRYGGISRISGTDGPLKSVRDKTVAATSDVNVLKRYIAT